LGICLWGGNWMLKRTRFEKLTHMQLQQKVIHFESELIQCQSVKEIKDRSYQEYLNKLLHENNNLRRELQERNKLIFEYNEILQKNNGYRNKLVQFEESNKVTELLERNELYAQENDKLVKLTEEFKKEAQMHIETSEKLLKEKQVSEIQVEQLKKDLSLMRKEFKENHQKLLNVQESEDEIRKLGTLLKKAVKEKDEIWRDYQTLQANLNELHQEFTGKEEKIDSLNIAELSTASQISQISTERNELKIKLKKIRTDKQELQLTLESKEKELQNIIQTTKRMNIDNDHLQQGIVQLQKDIEEYKNTVVLLQKKEKTLIQQHQEMGAELSEVHKKLNRMNKEKSNMENELQKKMKVLDDVTRQNKNIAQELEVIKKNGEQITQKNVSYLQKITQLDSEKHAALELAGIQQTEFSKAKSQLMELETLKSKILNRLKNGLKEVRRLKKENHQFIEEKAGLLKRIAILEEENTSFQDRVLQLSMKRESDEKRLDNISSKLNEVFTETKTIIKTASSLQDQLEAKNRKINQLKKENEILMQEINQLNNDFEKSEARKSELENQIEMMKTELLKAQDSLTRLEIFETEKLKLKDELETKIEEFNNLTDNYQREKDSYLQVLEHVQDQVNEYKEKSEYFDAEKGSWSKQIDQLKSELTETKATLVKMEELEQKKEMLTAELQTKGIEIYKIQKESEQALQNQMIQFNSELRLYQEKIGQYEKDKELAEKQMNELKAKFVALETSMKEKESFIRQFITQPQLPSGIQNAEVQPTMETIKQSKQPLPSENNPSLPQGQQSVEWFQRALSQQQGLYQNVQKSTNSSAAAMDFFTLRSKTTQPSNPGSSY
jgi:chromosome segregation ATPase